MELITKLQNKKIFLDSIPIIYFIERNIKYIELIKPIFEEIHKGNIYAITSTITIIEVLVQPLKKGDKLLSEKYKDILLYSKNLETFEITNQVSESAAKLRAKYNIKIPDAIQLAVAMLNNTDAFITNDFSLKKIEDINVMILDDYVKKNNERK